MDIGAGTTGSSPAITASTIAQQASELASGPIESRVVESGNAPPSGTGRWVGLNPVRPLSADGILTEPPVSVPIAASAILSVTEIAAPDDEPPGILALGRSQQLRGVP